MNCIKSAIKPVIFSLFLVAFAVEGRAQSTNQPTKYTGELFKEGSARKEKTYTLNIETSNNPEGQEDLVIATYKDLEGKVMVEEKGKLMGSALIRYDVDHQQTGDKGSVEVKDGRVYFTRTEKGETKTSEEKLGSTLVISSNFGRFVKENWEKVKAGKDVGFRYAAWQRRETVGFEIFKIGEEKINGQNAIVVKMKPSSFIIAALVKPLILKYSEDGSKILELIGRVPPMKKDGEKWKDLDAEVVYTHP